MVFGLAKGNLVGGFIGFIIGYIIEEIVSGNLEISNKEVFKEKKYNYSDYQKNIIYLISEIVKADGYIHKKEIYFIKDFLLNQFGSIYTNKMLKTLKLAVDNSYDVEPIARNIRESIDIIQKTKLVRFLYGITIQNGAVSEAEKILVQKIANAIGLSKMEYENIVFQSRNKKENSNQSSRKNTNSRFKQNAFSILEIKESATIAEIKKAYRKMVLKYHPDKSDMNDDIANEKFSAISEAYHSIKKQRGIK